LTEFFCFVKFGIEFAFNTNKQTNRTMKKFILTILVLTTLSFDAPQEDAFDTGEYFKFRIHYGIVNAGYATLEVKDATINNKKVFHAVGKGYTTGMSKFFFKVEDLYESYFDKETGYPYRYIRKIDEGGYTKDQEGIFNQKENRILVKDYKHKSEKTLVITNDQVQDIVSSFYYLRNHPNIDKLKSGESIGIDMFFDDEITKFKLKYVGRQDITTKFGTVSCMVFKPLVQTGRVFKEKESLTLWISDDDNKVPVRIKAELAVGSLKADLDAFKGLKHPFKVKK
jgi:hypothetical protein